VSRMPKLPLIFTWTVSTIYCLLIQCILILPSVAGEKFVYSRLEYGDEIKLDFDPSAAKLIPNSTLAVFADNSPSKGRSRLVVYDLTAGAINRTVELSSPIDNFALNNKANLAAVVGKGEKESAISLVDIDSGKIKTVFIAGEVLSPVIRFDLSGDIYLSDLKYKQIRVLKEADFLSPEIARSRFAAETGRPDDYSFYPGIRFSGSGTVRDFEFSADGEMPE
jgi:hypothetical protein